MRCHFVAVRVQVLHLAIIGPLVRHVERGCDRAAVRIHAPVFEQIGVQRFVQIVHRVVERQQNDLRRLLRRDSTWIITRNVTGAPRERDWPAISELPKLHGRPLLENHRQLPMRV